MNKNQEVNMEDKTSDFIKTETLKITNTEFKANIIGILIGYIGITLWLNAIRSNVSTWFFMGTNSNSIFAIFFNFLF